MTNQPTVRFKRLSARASIPSYQTEQAAGLDLAACLPEGSAGLILEPGQIKTVPCGFAMALPPGFEGQVRPRSGLAAKHGISVPNAPGTIDSDYRGEVQVILINLGREPFTVTHGLRIAQLVVASVCRATTEVVEDLDQTSRGSGGFGSTGLI